MRRLKYVKNPWFLGLIGGIILIAWIQLRWIKLPYISEALYFIVTLACGVPLLIRGIHALKFHLVSIECLVSIALVGALFLLEFEEAAMVSFLFHFGAYLELKTVKKTQKSI